jgi:hypothetical protein
LACFYCRYFPECAVRPPFIQAACRSLWPLGAWVRVCAWYRLSLDSHSTYFGSARASIFNLTNIIALYTSNMDILNNGFTPLQYPDEYDGGRCVCASHSLLYWHSRSCAGVHFVFICMMHCCQNNDKTTHPTHSPELFRKNLLVQY